MSCNVSLYKNISRHKPRIVARVEGDNYRFIYAGHNGPNNLEVIPADWFCGPSASLSAGETTNVGSYANSGGMGGGDGSAGIPLNSLESCAELT